jgi:hypothetical protein
MKGSDIIKLPDLKSGVRGLSVCAKHGTKNRISWIPVWSGRAFVRLRDAFANSSAVCTRSPGFECCYTRFCGSDGFVCC